MSKNVRMAILHIAVAVVCFIGALIFFNGRISMEKGSAGGRTCQSVLSGP